MSEPMPAGSYKRLVPGRGYIDANEAAFAHALWDDDQDTGIQTQESTDEDILRFDVGDSEGTAHPDILKIGGDTTGFIWNDLQGTVDFRLASPNNSHMLFIKASEDAIGFNTDDPTFTRDGGQKASVFGVLKADQPASQNGFFALSSTSTTRSADVSLLKSDGTWSAKTALSNSHVISNFGFEGYDGGTFRRSAMIRATVYGTVSSGVVPTEMLFLTGNSSTTYTPLRLHEDGLVSFGGTRSTPEIQFDSTNGAAHFNIQGNAAPFRVQTTTDDYALYNDGSNDTWAMGTQSTSITVNALTVQPKLLVDRGGGDSNINFIALSNIDSSSAGSFMVWARSRGSSTSPTTYTAVQSSDRLGVFRVDAHDGSTFLTSGDFAFAVDGSVSTGIVPTQFSIRLMDSTGTLFTPMSIDSTGRMFLNTSGGTEITFFEDGGIRANQNQNTAATADFIYFSGNYTNCFRIDVSADQVNIANSSNTQGGLFKADVGADLVTINNNNTGCNLEIESSASNVNLWESDTTNDKIIENGGKIVRTTRVTSGPYTVLANDHTIYVDTDSAAITVNLPAGIDGTYYRIINVGSSGNNVTVTPNGSELLLGANASDTLADGDVLIITYESTEGWF